MSEHLAVTVILM